MEAAESFLSEQLTSSKHHPRTSMVLLGFKIFMILFTINTVYAALIVFALYSNITDLYGKGLVFGVLWIVFTIQFLIQTVIILFVVLREASDEYYISEHQLFHYQGVWHVDERIYELRHIKSVKLYQSIFGKVFNFGTITLVLGARGYAETLRLVNFTNPKRYERLFRNFIQA